MAIFDFLSDVGRVVSPGLEAYGQGQASIASLKASLQNNLLRRLIESEKFAEEVRSNKEKERLEALKIGKMDALTAMLVQSGAIPYSLLSGQFNPSATPSSLTPSTFQGASQLSTPILGKIKGGASSLYNLLKDLSKGIGTSGIPKDEWLQHARTSGKDVPTLIGEFKQEFPNTPDTEIVNYFSRPVEKGQVGIGPLAQGNPQGGIASLRGSPIDLQQYLPRKEGIPSRLQQFLENRRGGLFDVQQYIPRGGYRLPPRGGVLGSQ